MIGLRNKITVIVQKSVALVVLLAQKIWAKYQATLEATNFYIYILLIEIIQLLDDSTEKNKKNKGNFYYHLLSYHKLRGKKSVRDREPAEIFDILRILLYYASISLFFLRLKNFYKENSISSMKPFFVYWAKIINYIIVSFIGTVEYITIVKINFNTINYIFYKPNFTTYRVNTFFFYKNIFTYNIFIVFYRLLKSLILPVTVSLVIVMLLLEFFCVNLVRQLAIWFVVGCLFFWLISGFNFFLKRYRFGKFTSGIQRFWKRANAYFWLIEGFLFLLFFYYYLNSSQEPVYMYDEASLNQTYLFSLINSYQNYLLLVFIVFYGLFFMITLTTFNTRQQTLHLLMLTLGLIYIYLIENYQVYYVLTGFFENFWLFDSESNTWKLESESPRLRVKHQYLLLALIAKYWHFLFIFLSWLFMVVKTFEQKKLSYVFFGVNIQNLMILFGLNFLFNLQWLKWLSRRYLDQSYFWFFTDVNTWYDYFLVNELVNFFSAVLVIMCMYRPPSAFLFV